MTYLITGATSFLGIELTKTLINQGHGVTAICRAQSRGLQYLPEGIAVVYAEMSEYKILPTKVSNADVFIHLAWEGTGHGGRDNIEIQQQNVKCTKVAMRAAHQMGCRLFVMAGSQAEYGITNEPQREDMECHPFSEYGKAKLQVQKECSRLAEELGIKYMHLRIFSLIGENDHPWTLVMSCVDKMLRNEPVDLSDCTQNWNFLYVRDAANQVICLCEYALQNEDYKQEIYNIASSDTRPLREFVERMRELTHSESEIHYGAIQPSYVVSLQPNVYKMAMTLKKHEEVPFDAVIGSIIENHRF